MLNYIAQVIGFAGLVFAIISFQKNNNKGILFFQVMASLTFFLHFVMLGAYTGAIMNLSGAIRNCVFYNREKSWADKKVWLYIFISINIIVGLLTWKNFYSILPIMATSLSCIGLWIRNPRYTRFVVLTSSPCWLVYNIISSSVAGVLTEVFALSSLIVGIYRFDIVKLTHKQKD